MFDVQIGHWESIVRPFCIDAEFNGLDVNLYQISYICIVDLSGQRKQFVCYASILYFPQGVQISNQLSLRLYFSLKRLDTVTVVH